MKILVAPLNWGLGHASRCIPLVRQFLEEGNEVILGGDGDSLTLLRKHFPQLGYVRLAPLNLRYSAGKSQVWAVIKALPKLILWAYKDHLMLRALLREEQIDRVVSDNRFGLYISKNRRISDTQTVYITHQLHIPLPRRWRWMEKSVSRLHAQVCRRYDKVWVPDYPDRECSLAGELSHPSFTLPELPVTYIGPLSRFNNLTLQSSPRQYDVVAVLSGLEPQRSILEQDIIRLYRDKDLSVLIVQGLMNRPNTKWTIPSSGKGRITLVPYMDDLSLARALTSAGTVIARSGYSTLMDLAALNLLPTLNSQFSILNCQLLPTPGQPEQEYLADWIKKPKKSARLFA